MEIIFFVSCVLYFIIALKVDEWITIYTLGFGTETPERFLTNPSVYKGVSSLLFLVSVGLLFLIDFKIVGGIAIAIAWFLSGYFGHKMAYKKYRKVLKEMIEVAESEKERRELQESLTKDDIALADELLRSRKLHH